CIHTIAERFAEFHKAIPWIALTLLLYIGGKMLLEGIRSWNEDPKASESSGAKLTSFELFIQGIATSIDALSVGFTIADYDVVMAFIASLIIAAVTLIICLGGLKIGRSFGTMLAGKASVLGGLILIGIGIEIFVKGMFF
ncbi:MAG: manganese efflux pump, partial [Lachnospiraceae bacterium]|nr:manganese efflux pump [Lachnospiraceae bacterium]